MLLRSVLQKTIEFCALMVALVTACNLSTKALPEASAPVWQLKSVIFFAKRLRSRKASCQSPLPPIIWFGNGTEAPPPVRIEPALPCPINIVALPLLERQDRSLATASEVLFEPRAILRTLRAQVEKASAPFCTDTHPISG